MGVHTDTQEFPSAPGAVLAPSRKPAKVDIQANGGQVAIETLLEGTDWIPLPDSPFTADTSVNLTIGGGRFRCTPSGGAKYRVEF